ncbi:hypothetical protein MKW98_020273 [Papaver atlanticum]|uniref:HECT-type E3 ubiquitin transferase n=1 Tax=Papaver atlanticum TaxID=357466 RepID=A0AAD4XSV4_9MAGN|nr:hypothetical protein MKW98_020273 [Papaver atlanticum]
MYSDSDSGSDSNSEEELLVWRSKEETQAARNMVFSIPSICSSCEISDPDDNNSENSSSTRARDLVSFVNDYLRMISTYNLHDSEKHISMFMFSGTPEALVSLVLNSANQCKLFLYPNIRFIPRPIRKHCVRLVFMFCDLLYSDDKLGNQHPLYYTCCKTLVSLLKLMGFRNTSKYIYVTEPSDTIQEFYPLVSELANSLCSGLNTCRMSSMMEPLPTSLILSIENDARLLAFFSRYMLRAIEDHVRLKGQSLPLNIDDDFCKQPCYLLEIYFFSTVYLNLRYEFLMCLANIGLDVSSGKLFNYTPRWPGYLSILRELKKFSTIYLNYEEDLFSQVRVYQYQVDVLVRMSKRSDDLRWLLEHKNSISSNTRDYLLMKMFPEMLIGRSQILTESFKHLSLGTSSSLLTGLSVEFRNEEAVGSGVLREWFFMICQELFDPKGSLFLACPSDCRSACETSAPILLVLGGC